MRCRSRPGATALTRMPRGPRACSEAVIHKTCRSQPFVEARRKGADGGKCARGKETESRAAVAEDGKQRSTRKYGAADIDCKELIEIRDRDVLDGRSFRDFQHWSTRMSRRSPRCCVCLPGKPCRGPAAVAG